MNAGYQQNMVRGLLTEAIVALLLDGQKSLTTATERENIEDDIDFYIGNKTVSVKCQDRGVETGNFSFELEQLLGYDHPRLQGNKGQWVRHQGFYCSKADIYAIVQGNVLYTVFAKTLKGIVKRQGWDRVATLSPSLLETQEGRLYVDARNGLIAREKVVPKGTIQIPSQWLDIRQVMVAECCRQGIDTEVLRDTLLMMDTFTLLSRAWGRQPDARAREHLVKYVIMGISLVA